MKNVATVVFVTLSEGFF